MGKGTEIVALTDYAIAKVGNDSIKDLIEGNLGGELLQVKDIPKVKIPAGGSTTWLVPPDDAPQKELEGIVIYQHATRALFKQSENGTISNDPPLCVADMGKVGIPAPESGLLGGACDDCPNSKYGSAGQGKKGQACKAGQRVYMLTQGSILPILLQLSPSSIAPWHKHMISLINTQQLVSNVVTRISLEKVTGGPAPYARIIPSVVRALTADEQKFVADYAANIVPVLRSASYAPAEDEVLEQAA
jgi:hypothetical protein